MSRWIGVIALVALGCAACSGEAPQTPAGPSTAGAAPEGVPSVTQGARIMGSVSAGSPLGSTAAQVVGASISSPAGWGSAGGPLAAMVVQVVGTSISSPVGTGGGFSLEGVPAGDVQLRFVASGVDASVALSRVQSGDVVSVLVSVAGAAATVQSESRNAGGTVQLEGRIESLTPADSALAVAGWTVTTNTRTILRDGNNVTRTFADLAVGQRVHVKGTLGVDSIVADSILIQNTDVAIPVNVNGIVESLGEPPLATDMTFSFQIGSRVIQGDGETKFYGEDDVPLTLADLKDGQRVEVKGEQRDGFVYALRIHINGVPKPEDPQDDSASVEGILQTEIPEVIPPGPLELIIKDKFGTETTVMATSSTVVQRRGSVVSLAALDKGQTIHAVGTRMSDGSIVAKMLQIKDDEADGLFVIEGSMGGLKGTCPAITFGVNGYTVKTDEDTEYFPDTPAPGLTCTDFNKSGMKVAVEGNRQADGSVLATKVTKK